MPPSLPGAAGDPASIRGLELIGEYTMPPLADGDPLLKSRFGGVSGLAVDPSSGELLGICDDNVDTRVFVLHVEPPGTGAGAAFGVKLHAYFPVPAGPGPPTTLDPEGIAITLGGRLFVASEGIGHLEPRVAPSIIEYTRGYRYVGPLQVPEKFHPQTTGPATRGVRANAAFESLTLTPDERLLYTATETALVQDGEPATISHGTLARILEYRLDGETFVPGREFAYRVDPLARPAFDPSFAVTGLVELLALGGTAFLSLERGYAEEGGEHGRRMNSIRIFQVSLDGATDVSGFPGLRGRPGIEPVRKRLLLDLGQLDGLSAELKALDNFEGMAFGPTLRDGSRTLLIVSDDNFSDRQRTTFLLFRISGLEARRPGPAAAGAASSSEP